MANGVAEPNGSSRRRARTIGVIAALIVIVGLDQLTKSLVVANITEGAPKYLVGHTIRIELARNSGAAFSRFRAYTPVLALVAIVITVFLVRTIRQTTDRWMLIGLVLVLGGALGNLVDRIVRSPGFLRGHVVDFVAVGWFPVFNVADSCITIGAIVLVVRTLFAPAGAPASETSSTE